MDNKGISPAALGAVLNGDVENAIIASTPGGIERQEAEGQQELCNKGLIPIRMMSCKKEDFEKMGIKFLGEEDDIFYSCSLPEGWRIVPTDHSMWNKLIDDKNRERAMIFYKAAFYDRASHISLCCRFSVKLNYDTDRISDNIYEQRKEEMRYCVVLDGDKEIFRSESKNFGVKYKGKDTDKAHFKWWGDYEKFEKSVAQLGIDFLKSKGFDDYQNPLAYWE